MRGAEVPGRGLPPVDELCRQVPLDLPDQEVAAAAAGNCLPTSRLEIARAITAHRWGARFLHRQLHHHGWLMGKWISRIFRPIYLFFPPVSAFTVRSFFRFSNNVSKLKNLIEDCPGYLKLYHFPGTRWVECSASRIFWDKKWRVFSA